MSALRAHRERGWLNLYMGAYLLLLYLPILLIPLFSFNDSVQAAFPLRGFTLRWYSALLDNPALSGAVLNSVVVGLAAGLGATLCGVTIAYLEVYGRSPLAAIVAAVARLPILIPGVVVGIALLVFVNVAGFGPSLTAIILAHILVALPTTVVIMRGRFAAIPRSIPEAAMDLGATDWLTFWRVMLPLSAPAIASAFVLAFLISFDEFIVAFFVAGREPTLPLYIWSQLRFPKSLPTVMALGTVMIVISVIIAVLADVLRRHGTSGAALSLGIFWNRPSRLRHQQGEPP